MSTVYLNFQNPTFPSESSVGPNNPLPVEVRAYNDAGFATGLATTAEGHLEVTLQPGEWITLAARAVSGSPQYVTGSINTREDQ